MTAVKNEKMNRVTVHLDEKPIYDIVMTEDFSALPGEIEKLSISNRRLCIVTDSNVEKLYLNKVKELLAPCCKTVISFVFPAGEEHKNLDTVRDLYETLILNHFDRNDMLAALGGGVVGDLCGFAAATYLRGVAFMQIPTTLLSQVDSSIGGKTGVDFDAYKNMVGAFHMPKLVFTNINTLQTLPDNQFSAGMGEVIKHGLIKDAAYYEWLLENAADIWARKPEALRKTVTWSNEIKRAVVEKDPTEKGDRMLLNFGHTLGHAIEKLKNFELLHGECVALGALAAMKLSENRGMIKPEETNRFKEALGEFHIGTQVSGLEKDAIVAASKNDKKMDSGITKNSNTPVLIILLCVLVYLKKFLFLFGEFLNNFYGTVDAYDTAVDAEVIALGAAPAFAGIIVIITRTLLIGLDHHIFCLIAGNIVTFHQFLNLHFLICTDENRHYVRIICQRIVRTPSYNDTGFFICQFLDRVKLCQENLVVDRHIHISRCIITHRIGVHYQ